MASPVASPMSLVVGEWSDADSIDTISLFSDASYISGSTCPSVGDYAQYLYDRHFAEEEPINFIQLEDNTFPFEVHTYPLYASDIDKSIVIVVVKAMLEFQNKGLLSRDVSYQHFILDVMDGYELDWKYHPRGSQTKMSDYLHCLSLDTFTLTYYPPFEVQFVLIGDDRRRVKENISGLTAVYQVKSHLASEVFSGLVEVDDIRLLHKGDELEDDIQELRDVFGLTSNIADPYGLYELQVMLRGCGGGKTTDKPSEKSMVKQFMPKKKDKKEEYKDICDNLNKGIGDISDGSAVIAKVKAFVKHFASVPEGHSGSVVSEGISNLDEERLKKCLAVLKKGNTTCNNGESKLEYIVKEMIFGVLQELTQQEKNVQRLKSALVLNLVKHCVNVSLRSGKVDVENIRKQMSDRLTSLTAASTTKDADVAMESLTDLFGRTKLKG